ncbi:hypothetical protein TWF718_002530 [Orbilia javanica]|uniref:Uncharacterized protein n=1 Tax=Orbilia javanica TaxID=47235 RepID=A0AAN8MK86_9PEZI
MARSVCATIPPETGAGFPAEPLLKAGVTIGKTRWFYPDEIKDDLVNVDIPEEIKVQALTCGFEYARSVIPHYTNWKRYLAFIRVYVLESICEMYGDLFRPEETDKMVGYSLQEQLDILFGGTPVHDAISREVCTFLVTTSEKSGSARDGSELFRRYVNLLANSPEDYVRLRDSDGGIRFTLAAALVCNDVDISKYWFTDEQLFILADLCAGLYDSVAYYKHRAEGEVCNFYAYAGGDMRLETTHLYREVLWALDAAWAQKGEASNICTYVRHFGGTIHMMMRRYRFVKDGLTIGKVPDSAQMVEAARSNVSLWYRVEAGTEKSEKDRYNVILAQKDKLLFDGLAERLERSDTVHCKDCTLQNTYGASELYQFSGVTLCDNCRQKWVEHVRSLPARAMKAFPELKGLLNYWD